MGVLCQGIRVCQKWYPQHLDLVRNAIVEFAGLAKTLKRRSRALGGLLDEHCSQLGPLSRYTMAKKAFAIRGRSTQGRQEFDFFEDNWSMSAGQSRIQTR
jgi:hypothetical protein